MQKIKYQALRNNDDDPPVTDYNLNENNLINFLQEWKKHCLLKVLLVCFVFVEAIYVIKSAQNYGNYNQWKTSKKENYSLAKSLPYNNISSISAKSAINDDIAVTTVAANNYDYFEIVTETSLIDEATMENTIEDNNYDSKNNSKKTKNNLNSNKINNKTTIKKLTTAVYINKKLLQTTEKIDANTTTTATIKTMTPSPVKTPAVKSSSAVEQKYFINTRNCHIPFVKPITPEIRKIFKPQHYTGCTKDKPIVTSSFNVLEGHYILHINYTVAAGLRKSGKKTKPIEDDLLCCYKQIVRSGSGTNVDDSFKLLPCTNFHQDFVVPMHINGIIVDCKLKSKKSTLQEDAFSFVQVNKTLMQQQSQNNTIKPRKPSILMIGIDTLSRINFRRNMPETYKYLVDNKWYELMGYNKIADNTLPNLMPLLSGYTKHTTLEKCHPKKVGGFDNCNFIWTTFKNNGYHTAYAEDSASISTFNYHSKGFKSPPTDYYFRPMALAIEKSMKRKVKKSRMYYCLGRKQFGEYIYDYVTEFAVRFKNQSSFGFFWTNSFSHNSYDLSATMDKTMVKYFKRWKKQGIFENSVIIFLSDHGARWGPLLNLSQGFLEERSPMFFISMPKWFHEEYPQFVKNLEINQKRLANAFDIHMTLQHLLKLGDQNYKIRQALDCPKCQSIFEELPENRTCDDASIPKAWCTCLPFKKESTENEVVQSVAKLILQEMNHYYELKNLTSICSPLELKKITNAKWRYADESKSSNTTTITTYRIDFITEPLTKPNTLFSATVDYDVQNKSIHLNIEDISRQSLYANTAKCTDDAQAKKYCICKNSLKLK